VFTDLFTATCRACGSTAVLRFRHWDGGQSFEITGDACDAGCTGEAFPVQANARLIAAAPDLLRALKELAAMVACNYWTQTIKEEGALERAQAAIRKAAVN
jgi:hypothetical protein